MSFRRLGSLLLVASSALLLRAEVKSPKISDQLHKLRSVPMEQKPAKITQLATDIRALPPGQEKVGLADELEHLSTEGDNGHDALQAVADTLTAALTESPIAANGDKVPMPYFDLAKLVHYEEVTTTMNDQLYLKSMK